MRNALLISLVVVPALSAVQIPVLQVSPVSLSFVAAGRGQPPAQQIRIRNAGSGVLRWKAVSRASWIRVSPPAGTAPAVLTVAIDAARLGPGRHEGGVTIDAGDADDSPLAITVAVHVPSPGDGLRAPPTAPVVVLTAPAGSATAASWSFTLDGPDGRPTDWRAASDQAWLAVDPAASTTPTQVTLKASPAGLSPGTHTGTVLFLDDAANPLLSVPVTLALGAVPAGRTSPPPAAADGAKPALEFGLSGALRIDQSALPPATSNLPYSQAIPVTGGKPPYSIRLVRGQLPIGLTLTNGAISGTPRFAGQYPLSLAVTDSASPPTTITRSLALRVIILRADTALRVEPATLTLHIGGGPDVARASLRVGSGGQPLEWKASCDAPWLRVAPAGGTSPGIIQVEASADSLARGSYVGTITVTMEGAPNSPARIPVQLTVQR